MQWLQADMQRDQPTAPLVRRLKKGLEDWLEEHAEQIVQYEEQEEARAALPGVRPSGKVPKELGDIVELNNKVTQRAMSTVCALKSLQEWKAKASHTDEHRASMRQDGNMSTPFLVVPTSKQLRLHDTVYLPGIRDLLLMPEAPEDLNLRCECGAPMSRLHAMTCKIVSKVGNLHRDMGETFRHCAIANRANPRPGEPRDMDHGDGRDTGADMRVDGMPVQLVGQRAGAVIDWTFPTVMARSNQAGVPLPFRSNTAFTRSAAGGAAAPSARAGVNGHASVRTRVASGDVERHAEAKKISNNEYQIDAEKNGLDFYGVAIGKDTGVFGPRMQELLVRMTSIRHGEEYENDPINQYGYTAGLWSAPTALDYWCKVLLVRLVARRETYIDQAYVRARRATRNGPVGGRRV